MLDLLTMLDSRLDSFLGADATDRLIYVENVNDDGMQYYNQDKDKMMKLPFNFFLHVTNENRCTMSYNHQILMSGKLTYSSDFSNGNICTDIDTVVSSLINSPFQDFNFQFFDTDNTFKVSGIGEFNTVTCWYGTFEWT